MSLRIVLWSTLFAAVSGSAAPTLFDAIRSGNVMSIAPLIDGGASVNGRDANGATPLMWAAQHSTAAILTLLLDRGADPNLQNSFGATALMWAAGDPAKVKILLDRGADPNLRSKTGRAALMIAAAYRGNAESVRLLLAKGADAKAVDATGDGPVGNAATSGDIEMLQMLLAAGGAVNERGNRGPAMRGMTPLMRAASTDCLECVRLLIARGADVNAVSAEPRVAKAGLQELGKFTALLIAAQNGSTKIVEALLDAGANVEARDFRGLTPLMMAVAHEPQDPSLIRMLIARGAKADAKATDGQSALTWAKKWGPDTGLTRLLVSHGATNEKTDSYNPPKPPGASSPRQAVERSLALLLSSNETFFQKGGCPGCHHQMITGLVLRQARNAGVSFDEAVAKKQLATAIAVVQPQRESALQRVPSGGAPMNSSFLLSSLGAQNHPPDALTDALVHDIIGLQDLNGSWHPMTPRPPLESSDFSETALAIRALSLYASPARKAEATHRIVRARQWLRTARPESTEDRAMQILGLHWSGMELSGFKAMSKALIDAQQRDGGWAQRKDFPSDAYATGQALFALHTAGALDPGHAVYRKGVSFLLSTQYADGSWHVRSRSVKFQPYFESGFPHGHDQWISAAATAWAAMALSAAVDKI